MCYDVATMTKKAKHYAKRYGYPAVWEQAKLKYPEMYHLNGFDEPDLPVITNEKPDIVSFHHWAFVPLVYAPKINGRPMTTLNARDDKIFSDKSVYKPSAENKRCLVMLDGFYDHRKKDGVAYPYFIQLKTKEPFLVGGLWQTFHDPTDNISINTVTLVTGPANKEMAWIHNEPAYSPDSRMIYIVDSGDDDTWLHGSEEDAKSLIKPLPDGMLDYYPCQPIKANKKLNRTYLGNTPDIQARKYYPELEEVQGGLF
ncbi:SOS response-associated peptidase [Ekhidna sp.]|uniref:SOS response-associated peptidase n=1 Tax=Ekhidna sp. TaxID=2608089 RepID=UPI003CCC1CF5